MSLRRWLLVLLLLAGLGLLATGIHGYASAWSDSTGDLASVQAAGRSAMRHLPLAALGALLMTAAGLGLWRDRTG